MRRRKGEKPVEPKILRSAADHEKRLGESIQAFVAAMNDALAAGYQVTDPILRRERHFACTVIEVDRAPRVIGSDAPPADD